jgi:Alpha/beta hydrolase family
MPPRQLAAKVRLPYKAPPLAFRGAMALLARFAPSLAARVGVRLFATPPHFSVNPRLAALVSDAERTRIFARGLPAVLHHIPGAGPRVLLMHGWGGHTVQMAGFIPALRAAGADIVAIDAPGHGHARGRMSTMFHFADAAAMAVKQFGPFDAAIAHSLGCTALCWAMGSGLQIPRVALMAPMPAPIMTLPRFCRFIGAPPRLSRRMIGLLEARYQVRATDASLYALLPAIASQFLLVHDADDTQVGRHEVLRLQEIAPNRMQTYATKGLGHARILNDPSVISAAVDFSIRGTFVAPPPLLRSATAT